jgi:hypothetical protein
MKDLTKIKIGLRCCGSQHAIEVCIGKKGSRQVARSLRAPCNEASVTLAKLAGTETECQLSLRAIRSFFENGTVIARDVFGPDADAYGSRWLSKEQRKVLTVLRTRARRNPIMREMGKACLIVRERRRRAAGSSRTTDSDRALLVDDYATRLHLAEALVQRATGKEGRTATGNVICHLVRDELRHIAADKKVGISCYCDAYLSGSPSRFISYPDSEGVVHHVTVQANLKQLRARSALRLRSVYAKNQKTGEVRRVMALPAGVWCRVEGSRKRGASVVYVDPVELVERTGRAWPLPNGSWAVSDYEHLTRMDADMEAWVGAVPAPTPVKWLPA